jgi:hypothetical protein
MVKVEDYFQVCYGANLELSSLELDPSGINFVSRTEKNNGVSARVKKIDDIKTNPANTISVAGGGNSVMQSSLQEEEYYSGRDLFYLQPKIELNKNQLLFYCLCLKKNRFRFNYGRQANKTLSSLLIPSIDEIPNWVDLKNDITKPMNHPIIQRHLPLNISEWKTFKYNDIFIIKKGYYNKKPPEAIGNGDIIPFVGASEKNNGITSFHFKTDIDLYKSDGTTDPELTKQKIFPGNCITVANNGNSVGYAFYQKNKFTCTHDVNPLYLKNKELNLFIALFLCTVIFLDKYRWNYGRKWRPSRMPNSLIRLPVKSDGKPDWDYMENFIKSLPGSINLQNRD